MSERAYVGVGSNIEPRTHVPRAIALLEGRYGPLTVSPVYDCPAVGFNGASFLNLVVGFDTDADPLELSRGLRGIEAHCGRDRTVRSASRTMDLDLLTHGELVSNSPGVRLPRADILRYAFTLKPLADIAPGTRHPTDGRTFGELWAAFDDTGQPLQPSDLRVRDR